MLVVLGGYAADGDCCGGELGGGCGDLTSNGITAPCSGPGDCDVGENELCEGWGLDVDRAPSSIFDSMPRRLALCLDQPNFFQPPDLKSFTHERFPKTNTAVSSNTPTSTGAVVCQKFCRDLKLEGPSNSFMLFIPKY